MAATTRCCAKLLVGTCVLSCFAILMCSAFGGVRAEPSVTPHPPRPTLRQRSSDRNRNQDINARHKDSYHRPLTPEQKADQNLQFMLRLYRSAAEPDGRLKQYRKFGSNTVRLLKPSVSSLHYLAALNDHHYTFTVEYSLDPLQLEQLIRASFLHFRSSSMYPSRGPGAAVRSPPCRARVASLGVEPHRSPSPGESVPLQPHHQWTETDVTAHVGRHILQRSNGSSLAFVAQYRCTDPRSADRAGSPSWWSSWRSQMGERASTTRMMMMRRRWRMRRRGWSHRTADMAGYHLEAPSLLLYLEEQRVGQNWMEELLAGEDKRVARMWRPLHFASNHHQHRPQQEPRRQHHHQRSRRSALDSPGTLVDAGAFPVEALKEAAASSSPPSASVSPNTYEAIPGMPNYRRKVPVARNRCRLHSLRLSFEDLGLGSYFIAPPGYNPRYCQGECPRVLHNSYHSPNHAIMQTKMREMGVSEDVPAISCVPYKYMPMSVLVHDKKRVEYRELEDMIAESCTCR